MNKEQIEKYLNGTLKGFKKEDVKESSKLFNGKVRDVFDLGSELIISTSDRISAFDKILGTIPCKGEVLNRLALHWFKKTEDIIENHIIEEITPRTIRVKKCEILPVEVIIRGYLTGSAWRDYQDGKAISGIKLPEGMKMNQKFDTALITPSTKAEQGEHDEPISCEEIVKQGLVKKEVWDLVEKKALELFKRGTDLAAENGLILVDTKYEFGLLDGKLIIADEVHTPDSSRFWYADTYKDLFEKGESQRILDKEFLRQWLIEKGFMGDGEAPIIPDDMRVQVASRYIEAFEKITGDKFTALAEDNEAEREKVLSVIPYRA